MQGGKVIKFSLVGAICVLIMVVSLIIGLVKFIPKWLDDKDENEKEEEVVAFGYSKDKSCII